MTYDQAISKLMPHFDLLNIETRSDVKSLEVLKIYEDDHLQCADVIINDVPVQFLWYDDIGFLEYWDESDRAFKALKDSLINMFEIELDATIDELDNEEDVDRLRLYFDMI